MTDGDRIITRDTHYSAAYFSAKAAEIGLKRLALNMPMVGDVDFGSMRLRLCEGGGLVVFLTSPAEVKFEIGGDYLSIIPRT